MSSSDVRSSSTVRSPPAIRCADLRRDRRRARDRVRPQPGPRRGLCGVDDRNPAGAGFRHRFPPTPAAASSLRSHDPGFRRRRNERTGIAHRTGDGRHHRPRPRVERRHRARPARNARPDDRPDDTKPRRRTRGRGPRRSRPCPSLGGHPLLPQPARSRRVPLGHRTCRPNGSRRDRHERRDRRHLGRGQLGAGRAATTTCSSPSAPGSAAVSSAAAG